MKKKKTDWSKIGYTDEQLLTIIPKKKLRKFYKWMYGQTMGLTEENKPIYYKCNVHRFLDLEKTGRKEHSWEWD